MNDNEKQYHEVKKNKWKCNTGFTLMQGQNLTVPKVCLLMKKIQAILSNKAVFNNMFSLCNLLA